MTFLPNFFIYVSTFGEITPSPPTKYTLSAFLIFLNVESGKELFLVRSIGAFILPLKPLAERHLLKKLRLLELQLNNQFYQQL